MQETTAEVFLFRLISLFVIKAFNIASSPLPLGADFLEIKELLEYLLIAEEW